MTETMPEKRLTGYARASIYGQTLDAQSHQLRAAGCSRRNIYCENMTVREPTSASLSACSTTSLPVRGDGDAHRPADAQHFDLFGIISLS
jgi:hypothetical protein